MSALHQLRTPRLLLNRIDPADLEDFVRFYADPSVTATLGGVRDAAWVADYLEKQIAHWNQHGFGFWTLRDAATRQFVGRGGLRHATVEGQVEIEVGYGLLSEFWGLGLATELASESVHTAFTKLSLKDLVTFTLPTNLASRRVMEKAGFRYDRDITYAGLPHLLYRQSRIDLPGGSQ